MAIPADAIHARTLRHRQAQKGDFSGKPSLPDTPVAPTLKHASSRFNYPGIHGFDNGIDAVIHSEVSGDFLGHAPGEAQSSYAAHRSIGVPILPSTTRSGRASIRSQALSPGSMPRTIMLAFTPALPLRSGASSPTACNRILLSSSTGQGRTAAGSARRQFKPSSHPVPEGPSSGSMPSTCLQAGRQLSSARRHPERE